MWRDRGERDVKMYQHINRNIRKKNADQNVGMLGTFMLPDGISTN